MKTLRIMIADDHEVVRMGIRQVLAVTHDLEVAGEATTGNELLALLRATNADVILTDLAMPGISGLDLIRRIRVERPATPVLVHSMYADGQTAARVLGLGALGYITKGSDARTLIDGIRGVAAGARFISGDLMDDVLSSLTSCGCGDPLESLSAREFEIYQLFVEGHAVGEIAASLSLSPKTVSTHKVRLMKKIGVKTDADLIRYAMSTETRQCTPPELCPNIGSCPLPVPL